jgi:O-antigen chain-terminating methyltransferase
MSDDFYRAFEDRYRGSRELILSRLRVYLPFVEPLKRIYPECRAVDLGCGRGEWIELMGEVGIDGHGVDLDDGMLAACRERGLSVEQRDAIEYLEGLPAESVAVVSAFHVAEHIPFTVLQTLVQEALRVLLPAGLIILETPNPENLSVGANTFYLDPTHERPIPPPLLAFLPEHYGFARTKVLRLQEAPGLRGPTDVTLTDVLMGVSPDYAIVAQKGSRYWKRMARFDAAFSKDYGLDLGRLAMNYDSSVGSKLGEILAQVDRSAEFEARAAAAEAGSAQANAQLAARVAEIERLNAHIAWQQGEWDGAKAEIERLNAHTAWQQGEWEQTQARASELEARLQTASGELHALHQANHHHYMLAEARQQRIDDLLASTSWRITAPMRTVSIGLRALARMPSRALLRAKIWLKPDIVSLLTRPGVRAAGGRAARWLLARPRLSRPIKAFIGRHPRLGLRLRYLFVGQVGFGHPSAAAPHFHAGEPTMPGMAGFDQPGGALAKVLTDYAVRPGIHADQCGPLEATYWSYLSGR